MSFGDDDMLASFNNYMAYFSAEFPDRLKWAGLIPWQDRDLAIEELRRTAEMGMKGLNFKAVPVGGREWSDPYYDPLYAELQELRGEKVSLIFQEPMGRLDPLMRVEDQFVEMIRAHRHGVSKARARRMCHETLASLGIPPRRARQWPHEFSGGMRQRIMIGLGIVLRPRLVVADEPTTALDTLVQAQILDILRRLADDQQIAVLLITHNIGAVAEICDRVAVMYAAKVVEVGRVEQVLVAPAHPYTRGLVSSVIHLDTEELSSIPGSPPDLAKPPPGCRFHPRCPYVMDVCSSVEPPAVAVGGGTVACWLHVPEGSRPTTARPPGTPP